MTRRVPADPLDRVPNVYYPAAVASVVMSVDRSYLFVPGSDADGVAEAIGSVADVVIVDLEDTVSPDAKAAARTRTLETLTDHDERSQRLAVRVNGVDTERGIEDVRAIATADVRPDLLLLPDVRDASEVRLVDDVLNEYDAGVGLHPLIEKPSALFDAQGIARVSERLHGLMFAAIDFQMNMGMSILDETDLSVPRFLLSMAANGAGIHAVDKPNLAAVHDEERTRAEARAAKAVGFDGKAAMTTEQAAVINDVFTPSAEEVARAKRVIEAFEATEEGVAVIEGAAVDKPVVDQLRALVDRAESGG